MPSGERRWNGWGRADERFEVPAAARAWLAARLGEGDPLPAVAEAAIALPPPRRVPPLPVPAAADAATRLRHACGQSFPDLVALRTGRIDAYPDAVCTPADADGVIALLRTAAAEGMVVVPRGGGTSVVGGVTIGAGPRPVVVVSLAELRGLRELDRASLLATFGAGTLGPEVESALAPRGLRLGHEPQSFEFSSVGGWVATRSAGQRSTGVGKIDDLLAGVEVATAAGMWRIPAQPASAAGPDPRRLVLGSEGRLGVITAATLRVRAQPEAEDGEVVLLPSWSAGLDLCRDVLRRGLRPEVLRLSDPAETGFATALVAMSPLQARVSRLLFGLPRYRRGCLLLLGWAGEAQEVILARQEAARLWRGARGFGLGRGGWRRWRAERFRHPYLRDELLSLGWGVDTLETAAPWARLADLWAAVPAAITEAAAGSGARAAVLCHLSHAYRDGASLYFTFFWPLRRGGETAQWGALKAAATRALLAAGGTLSHHHGVGTMHAPWIEAELGAPGVAAFDALSRALDPAGTLNPRVIHPRAGGDGAP